MARSIHDTRGVLERAMRADWSDPEIPRAIEAEMTKNWLRQGGGFTGADIDALGRSTFARAWAERIREHVTGASAAPATP